MSKSFLSFLFLIFSYSNFAEASPILVRVALSEDYKPLSYGAGENVEGFVRELVELLFPLQHVNTRGQVGDAII